MLVGFNWLGKYTEGWLVSVIQKQDNSLRAVIWHPEHRWLTMPLEDVTPQYPTGREK